MPETVPGPSEFWQQAGGGTPQYDRERYLGLMRQHGHIVKCKCACHAERSGHCGECRPQLPCGWPGPQRPAGEWCVHELAPGTCSVCTGRGEQTPEVPDTSRLGDWFEARFPGRCGGCGERIREGDRIRWDGESAYLCENCGEGP